MSRARAWRVAALGAVVTCLAAAPQAPPELSALFPERAPIFVDGRGISRLLLPAEVLSACRPDLSDLRVLDRQGREVAFVVDSGPAPDRSVLLTESLTPEVLAVGRRRVGRESGPPLWEERYDLALPASSYDGGQWVLVFATGRGSFVRRVDVYERSSDGNRSELALGASIFRLRDPLRERLDVELPEIAERTLSVTLSGEDGPYLEPVIRLERSRELPGGDRARVLLSETRRRRADGRTEIELDRPRGLVPDLVSIETATTAFKRDVEIWDEGPGASDSVLGGGTIFRVPTVAAVEGLSVPLAPARGDRLRVIIDDGDSPPLGEIAVRAVVRRPALLFALPEGASSEPSGSLLFGGGRAFRPRYDLEGVAKVEAGPLGELAAALADPDRLATARLGAPAPNSTFDGTPALAFAQRPGAELDRGAYSHSRRVSVRPSAEGLSSLEMTPEDVAVLRPDLADLRIVDDASRQWAYLVEERARAQSLMLPVMVEEGDPGVSDYVLALPASPVVVDRVVIHVREPFFDRGFELRAGLDAAGSRMTTVAGGRLVRRANDPRPVTINFAPTRVHTLTLSIENGDDAPLVLDEVAARFPLPEVFFAAPEGEYVLLLGKPDAAAPRYELEQIREIVLAVESSPALAGRLSRNPDYRPGPRILDRQRLLTAAMWLAIAALVVVLTVLTLRLVGTERDTP